MYAQATVVSPAELPGIPWDQAFPHEFEPGLFILP